MKTRPLGKTGYVVSELGHGGWGLGGDMWRGVDDADGREAHGFDARHPAGW